MKLSYLKGSIKKNTAIDVRKRLLIKYYYTMNALCFLNLVLQFSNMYTPTFYSNHIPEIYSQVK